MSEELAVAIEREMRQLGMESGSILTDWAVVAVESHLDEDGESQTGYHLLFSNGEIPPHVGIGLFEMGANLLKNGQAE